MQSEPLPARILMMVIDPAHPRFEQKGLIVRIGGEDIDEQITKFTLRFKDRRRATFTAAQVRLVRGG